MAPKKAVFGKKGGAGESVLVVAFMEDGTPVTGALSGKLHSWQGTNCSSVVPAAHKGSVNCLFACRGGLVSGGKDGKVLYLLFNFL